MRKSLQLLALGYFASAAVALAFIGYLIGAAYHGQSASHAPYLDARSILCIFLIVIISSFAVAFGWLGILLAVRRRRRTALVIAGISCLGIPLGTILGPLTIYALTRSTVTAQFAPTA